MIKENENGVVGIVRGSRLPVKVETSFNAGEVLNVALKKHADHDQFFCSLDSYVLMYPDQKPVGNVPGTENLFTVELYKQELSKPYSKVNLYICNVVHVNINVLSDDDHDDESVKENFPTLQKPMVTQTQQLPTSHIVIKEDVVDVVAGNCSGEQQRKVFCPVCNNKYSIDEIEFHVNNCLEKQNDNPFMVSNDLEALDSESNKSESEEEDPILTPSSRKCTEEIFSVLKNAEITDEIIHINVRRQYVFNDFRKCFNKKWNAKKKNSKYKITFVGEAGLDTGGLSREFYSGNFNYALYNGP